MTGESRATTQTDSDQIKPAILLSAPRSGSTLLRRLLNGHPDIASPGETSLFKSAASFFQTEPIATGVEIGCLPALQLVGIDDERFVDSLRSTLFGVLDSYAAEQQAKIWVEKTAFNCFYVNEIASLCGSNAKFVCLVRHGLDVACSIEELCQVNEVYLQEIHKYVQQTPRPLEAFARIWIDVANQLINLHEQNPENTILVRYEELLDEPEKCLQEIVTFLGLEWHDDVLKASLERKDSMGFGDWKTFRTNSLSKASVNRWHQRSSRTQMQLFQIMGPTLRKFGYEVPDVEGDDDNALRRYELAQMVQGLGDPDAVDE